MMRYSLFLLLVGCLHFVEAGAQEGFPVPPVNDRQLFYLQRTSNTNTIVYELNYKDGKLNERNPLHVYWIRYTEQGQKAELSWIQRVFAYGIKAKLLGDSSYQVTLVSYAGYKMSLRKGADGKYRLYAPIYGKMMELRRVFVKITGGSMWSPDIEYYEVSGIDPATGKPIAERKKILANEIKE
ncbi:DUF4833 domain-containing protein [Paraflavitalea sp. CAU 1676]|uniref:DUF4833 domain-containing protein n=1 Tax=Paraflavitalea sp. CAU 1676 TaxID=3032598 RepID=UPI0023DA9D71|nr:DUF4833 domain-containing protein [Paraflavitalea sp. CAU 1676]MDF2193406.1 DUF4833 domain-containing protein [Paraflavitalea sp. CAU 1676]